MPARVKGSHRMVRTAALSVFNRRIGPDRELIIPSNADIDYFSSRHSDIFEAGAAYADGLDKLGLIYEESPQRLIIAQSLLDLRNDPRTSGKTPRQIWTLIRDEYPALCHPALQDPALTEQRFLAQAVPGGDWFNALLGSFDKENEIRCDYRLSESLFQLALRDPEEVHNWSHFVGNNAKFLFQFIELFSEFNDDELLSALHHLGDKKFSEVDDRLIALANKLYVKFPHSYLPNDSTVFSFFTPLQGAILQKRQEIIQLGAQHLHEKYNQIFRKGLQGHPSNIEQTMRPFINAPKLKMGRFDVTQQFVKDHVRYDEVILADRQASPMSYPGQRTLAQAGLPLLEGLEQLATFQEEVDPELFFKLQEAVSQNLKIRSFQHWLLRKMEKDVGAMPSTLLMMNPKRDCVVIERLSDLRIDCTYDFQVQLLSPHDDSIVMYRARITIPIIKVKDKWVYGQPQWIPLGGGVPSLQELYQATPLASLPAPVHAAGDGQPAAADVQAMLQAGDAEESDDEEAFYNPHAAAAAAKQVIAPVKSLVIPASPLSPEKSPPAVAPSDKWKLRFPWSKKQYT